MKALTPCCALVLSLSGCTGSHEPEAAFATSSGAPTTVEPPLAATSDADGFPDGFTYPPGATVKTNAPGYMLYVVPNASTDAVAAYWEKHLSDLGFEKSRGTEIFGFYQHGTTPLQITWNQADTEVRGAANVLTP